MRKVVTFIAALWCVTCASADDYAGKQQSGAAAPRYTFSWPLGENALAPRGGTTKGAPVTLDLEPSKQWQDLPILSSKYKM